MKKYLFLTTALIVAACGAGTSGDNNEPGMIRASSLITTNKNTEITSMASAVVLKQGSSYIDVARGSKAPDTTTYAGYTIYKLDNVDFKIAGEDDAIFNFEIDNSGRIVQATANGEKVPRDLEDSSVFHGKIFQLIDGSDDEVRTYVLTPNSTQQDLNNVRDEYLADKLGKETTDLTNDEKNSVSWKYLEQDWKFDTRGRDKNLTYSDFGYFTATNVKKLNNAYLDGNEPKGDDNGSNHSTIMLFSGGYDILPETTKPGKGARFEGTAVGVIRTSIDENGPTQKSNYGHHHIVTATEDYYNSSEMAKLETQHARLDIDNNGNTILSMPFGSDGTGKDTFDNTDVKWYDVEVTSYADPTKDNTISFNLPTNKTEEYITTRFKHDGGNTNNNVPVFNERYYGITTPEEATGTVAYEETRKIGSTNIDRDFKFEAAYGLK